MNNLYKLTLIAISILSSNFSYAGFPKAALCRERAVQTAAVVASLNDSLVWIEKSKVELEEFESERDGEENYGFEKWMVQFKNSAPITVSFSVSGTYCRVDLVEVSGL